jgi:nicotinamide-nucleotide amidase
MSDGPVDDLLAIVERLQALCLARGLTVATAESCTGGLVASTLTDLPGSSGYVLGGVVAYADRIKTTELDVPPSLIADHGAVSPHVARAMALGARARFGSTLAVAVTGIAGPGGGTAAKPVGLTYLAVAGPLGVEARRLTGTGDRAENKTASARAAVELLLSAAETTEGVAGAARP